MLRIMGCIALVYSASWIFAIGPSRAEYTSMYGFAARAAERKAQRLSGHGGVRRTATQGKSQANGLPGVVDRPSTCACMPLTSAVSCW